LFLILNVHVALCTPSAPVVYVAGDGTGDFNCNGSNDHIPINQALLYVSNNSGYTTVHLKGPFTYVINDSLLIGSNTILEGDSTVVIQLANNANWSSTTKPLIRQKSDSGNSNITIRGFEVNGNYAGNSNIALGTGYYNVMYFTSSSNIKVYNMYMHDGTGDGLRVNKGNSIQFYNNTIYKLGHDGMFALRSENVEAWNNRITCRTNSGLRVWNTNEVKLHDNVIDSFYEWDAGGPGIQIEKGHDEYSNISYVVNNVEIYNNTINNTYGPGIWVIGIDNNPYPKEEAQNVHIYHNTFYNTGTNPNIYWAGGIVAAGFDNTSIENNVFDGVYHAAIVHMYNTGTTSTSVSSDSMSRAAVTDRGRLGFDDVSTTSIASDLTPSGSGYTTIVRNNIIVNTQKRTKDPTDTGYAIINNLPDTHSFVLDNNCLYNNTGGSYKNASSTTDIYVDPLFVDQKNHNYYLMSKAGRWNGFNWVNDSKNSPCIDAGYPLSDYSNEPEPNGGRINIGPQGNTIYASKSDISIFGYINPPKDLDHDGLYEDINGNGQLDFDDVVAYYDNMDSITQKNLTPYFDFKRNGVINFDDFMKLYDMVGTY
jgi:hypothetical protein